MPERSQDWLRQAEADLRHARNARKDADFNWSARRRSLDTVVVKSLNEAAVRRAMDQYAASLFAEQPQLEEVVVFGSMAEGNYAPGSDIDVLLVLSRSDEPVWDRVPRMLPRSFPIPVDLFPYTREDLARLSPSPVIAAAQRSRWRYQRAPGGFTP